MKKLALSLSLVGVLFLAFAFGSVGTVSAQAETPQGAAVGNGYGIENRGGRGAMGNGQMVTARSQDGVLHDGMIEFYAAELGISVEDLNARIASGETLSEIAFAEGLTTEEFTALRTDARSAAIDQAVVDGTLTQEQADWMKSRSGGAMRGGMGARGGGLGQNANPDCPYYTPVTP